jgi:PAS domain S-box-containing protein
MMSLRDLPIKTKLKAVMVMASAASLILASGAFVAYEVITARQKAVDEISTLADLVGANLSAALVFDNVQDAEQSLATLHSSPQILRAAVYKDNSLFAQYERPSEGGSRFPKTPAMDGWTFAGNRLVVIKPIELPSGRVGTIYLESDLERLRTQLYSYGIIGVIVLGLSLATSLVVASVLQRNISKPILDLAETTRHIAERHDYSIRVQSDSRDELGILATAFDDMISEIHQHSRRLQRANEDLQEEVRVRTKAEAALRESEVRFRELAESMPQIVWSTDRTGRVDYFNHQWLKFTGIHDGLGDGWYRAVHPRDLPDVHELWQQGIQNGSTFVAEYRLRRSDGEYRWHLSRGTPIRDAAGEVTKWFGTTTEIHDLKQAEADIRRLNEELEQRVLQRTAQLEAANKELEAFSYSVSHDLRAPLRAISAFSGMLKDDAASKLTNTELGYLDTIMKSVNDMGALVDGLLNFSRLNRKEIDKSVVHMQAIVQQALADQMQEEPPGRHVEVTVGNLPEAYGDPVLLKQVVVNLISNAFKFSRNNPAARVDIGCKVDEKGEPIYFVRDNGAGFDMQYQNKLFGVFQRLHHGHEFEGTGVGLALAQRIIFRHGGQIWAEGKLHEGATFYFSLPQD